MPSPGRSDPVTGPGAWAAGAPADVLDCFESMPAVMWAFEGPELRVVAANAGARASGGNRPDMVGRPIREVLPEIEGQQIFEIMDRCFASGEPVTGQEMRILVDRDGDGRLEEGFYTYTIMPTRRPDGTVRGLVVLAVEATELVVRRRAAESRAVESEQRYQAAADVVLILQRNLLPDGVPVLPRVRLATHYVVAGSELAAGGDWFDTVPLNGDRVWLIVGDVVGHGSAASAAMGQLRTVAVQALGSGADLAETVARLDSFAARSAATRGATACLAVLDPATGRLELASHAHPPPLVLDVDGNPRLLPAPPAGPLGTGSPPPAIQQLAVAPGELLLLYSDGLVERPGRTLSAGIDELAAVVSAALRDRVDVGTSLPDSLPDRVGTLAVERLGRVGGGFRDDVTLLAAQLLATAPAPLELEVPARPAALTRARRALSGWLDELGAGLDSGLAVVHAASEALTNAVEHAYSGAGGAVALRAGLDGRGVATVVVADAGRWRPAPRDPAGRGRGLVMMRALVEDVELAASAAGTTVTLRHPLRRDAVVGVAPGAPMPTAFERAAAVEFDTELLAGEEPVLAVRGPVDLTSIDALRARLLEASRGGALPITVDLSEVTHLASAGVHLLSELASGSRPRPRLVVPAGHPAREVLTLTGLDGLLAAAVQAS